MHRLKRVGEAAALVASLQVPFKLDCASANVSPDMHNICPVESGLTIRRWQCRLSRQLLRRRLHRQHRPQRMRHVDWRPIR